MKRARYKELRVLADQIIDLLVKAGIKPSEGCMVRNIAETEWNALRAEYSEVRGTANLTSNQACEATIPLNEDVLSDTL